MPRSSRHKSHRQSKHSSKDYPDSEEDVKMKDKRSRDENLTAVSRDPVSGDKRKLSSHAREGKEGRDPTRHGNGEATEEYLSSKRRKDNDNIGVAVDKLNGGVDERRNKDRIAGKETSRGDSSKFESKSKQLSNQGESLRVNATNKSKRHESVAADIEENLTSLIPEEEDGKSRGESRKKSESDCSSWKEERELKGKDFRVEKEEKVEKILGRDTKRLYMEVKAGVDAGKKPVSQLGDLIEERRSKQNPENAGDPKNPEIENVTDKRVRKKRESSIDIGVPHDDFKESEERGLSARNNHKKDVKIRDNKDRVCADQYQYNNHKNDDPRDEKNQGETKENYKYRDDRYGEGSDKTSRRRDDRHRGEVIKENRTKDEKYREKDKDAQKKDNYRDATERDGRHRERRYHDDNERDGRRRYDRYHEDGDGDERHRGDKYSDYGDDRCRENKYKEDSDRDNRSKEGKHRECKDRGSRRKDSKQGDDINRDRRMREKYQEEFATGDCSGDKSGSKHVFDDGYTADHHSRKFDAYEDSPKHDDQTVRYRDDQGRQRIDDREDYANVRSQNVKDQMSDAEKKTGSSTRMDSFSDRGRSTPRNAELELNLSHRRRHSPNPSTLAGRDHYRLQKQDEYRSRDYGHDDRVGDITTSTRDYASSLGGSEKTPSRSLEKVDQKEDGYVKELCGEREIISDIHLSPLKLLEKSTLSSTYRRQSRRSNVRPSIEVEESTQRSGGGYRDVKDYSGKVLKEYHELAVDELPGEELLHVDVDKTFVSTPLSQNNHLSGSSKSFPPLPPFRTGSPLISCSTEDDNRFQSNFRSRRSGDPNVARIQGNAWREVPSWPSPVANGFMSFPHAPPPVGFHSMIQPFPSPVFGIRPSMDMNIPASYHISDSERFGGPVHPMGWHNQVDDLRPPLHAWDGSNAVFQEENHMYERPGWNQTRKLPGGRGWDTSGDMWNGPSKNASFEMPSYEVREPSMQAIEPSQNGQLGPEQQSICSYVHKSTYNTKFSIADDPSTNIGDAWDKIAELPKDNMSLCNVYLSRLDISSDLTDPEIFNKCIGFVHVDSSLVSDVDDSKILAIKESSESEAASHQILSFCLPTHFDDSFFQRAMSLFMKQKEDFNMVVDGEKKSMSSEWENLNVEAKRTDHFPVASDMHVPESSGSCSTFNSIRQKPVSPTTKDNATTQENLTSTLVSADHVTDKTFLTETIEGEKDFHSAKELMAVNDKIDSLINSDVFEAMMPECESVNLRRIHDSPSTH